MTGLGPPRVGSRDAARGVPAAGQGEESLLRPPVVDTSGERDLEGRVSACSFPVPDLLPGPEEGQLHAQVPGALLIAPGSVRLLSDLALIQEIDPGGWACTPLVLHNCIGKTDAGKEALVPGRGWD